MLRGLIAIGFLAVSAAQAAIAQSSAPPPAISGEKASAPASPEAAAPAMSVGEAAKAVLAAMPKGARPVLKDGQFLVQEKDAATPRAPNPAEAKAMAVFVAANAAERARQHKELLDALSTEERADLENRVASLRTVLPPNARVQREKDAYVVTLADGSKRAPNEKEAAALASYDALTEKITARLREKAIGAAPLRVLPNQSLAAKTGQVRRGRDAILSQTIVFNRAAKLKETLVAAGGMSFSIEAGTKLFVMANEGTDYYCLPRSSAWRQRIPCFRDTNGDKKLDAQFDGGEPVGDVYMFASGFRPFGSVKTPASFDEIPYQDGYQQLVGIVWNDTATDKKTGVRTVYLTAAVSDAGKYWQVVNGAGANAKLDEKGQARVTIKGAEIEVTQSDPKTLAYRIVKPMPEQPFGLNVQRTYTTTYIPIYIPAR